MYSQAVLGQILSKASLKINLEEFEPNTTKMAVETDCNVKTTAQDTTKIENKNVTTDNQPPPNCYTDGKICANFRTYDYTEIYRYTSRRIEIKTGGDRHIPCEKCSYFKRHFHGVAPDGFCGCHELACIRDLDYFSWCLCNTPKFRAELVKKGLWTLALNGFIGYDADRRALIFILDKTRYIELPFTDGEFNCDRVKVLTVIMHFNIDKPNTYISYSQTPAPFMPYLDNRFYGIDGSIVIAENQCDSDVVLPFNRQ